MIKTILFDMDGLMIDSERITFEGYQSVLEEYGKEITLKQYQTFLGRTVVSTYELLKEYYGMDFPSEEVVRKVHTYIEVSFEERGIPVKPGLYELLQYLKENQYTCAVVTSSSRDRVKKILSSIHVLDFFDCIVCGDDVHHGKPNPEIFLTASKKLNAKIEQCLILEDAQTGIEAAYRGGFDVIVIPDMKYPEKEYQAKTKSILSSLYEVIPYLETQKKY